MKIHLIEAIPHTVLVSPPSHRCPGASDHVVAGACSFGRPSPIVGGEISSSPLKIATDTLLAHSHFRCDLGRRSKCLSPRFKFPEVPLSRPPEEAVRMKFALPCFSLASVSLSTSALDLASRWSFRSLAASIMWANPASLSTFFL